MDIVARAPELEAVAGLIDRSGEGSAALLIEGEAGIGKTTLWQWGVDRARARGDVVLTCRPAETESGLPFAALDDLLEPILAGGGRALTPRQRQALEAALARIEPGETLGRLTVARAALAVIKGATKETGLVIAVDDAQWLDRPSAEALEFIVRRLDPLSVRILVTRRGQEDPIPIGLDRAIRAESFFRMWLVPFEVGELDELLRTRIDLTLPRPRLIELQRITGGNPFYALEVGLATLRRDAEAEADFAVPDSLADLLRQRLLGLTRNGRDAVLLAAATSHPRSAVVEKAAGTSAGLEEAIREGVLELKDGRILFAHPLLASVAYDSTMPWDLRELHGRLAVASSDPLERARHLALSTDEADALVAEELDAAAIRAYRLGAVAAAAEIADHACRLTPPTETAAAIKRSALSAEYHLAAGDSHRGRALLEDLVERLPAGPQRGGLLLRLAQVRFFSDEIAGAEQLFRQVLDEAGEETHLVAEAEQALAFAAMFGGDLPRALGHAQRAYDESERIDDEGLIALSLGRLLTIEFLMGQGVDRERMDKAIRLEDKIDGAPVEWLPSYAHAGLAQFVDDLDTAREIYADLYATSLARADERALSTILFSLSQMECLSGNWALAYRYANESIERSRQSGYVAPLANALSVKAQVGALLGREVEARAALEEGMEITARTGAVAPMTWLTAAGGFLELSLGDFEAAHRTLGPLSEMMVAIGLGEPGVVRFLPDEIEALVSLGNLEPARRMTTLLEERGRALDRPWALATGARSAALVAAAEGDLDEARDAIARALKAHDDLGQPFELGRTRLVEGVIERRGKKRGRARDALTEALEIFDALGAPLWAAKAAAELARIPGREPSSGDLTPTERKVAELVASGLSNKEVAAKLFVTVRTVEWNLSKVYAKLGARSRTDLAGRLPGEGET